MDYRTDLAVELDELLEEARLAAKQKNGAILFVFTIFY